MSTEGETFLLIDRREKLELFKRKREVKYGTLAIYLVTVFLVVAHTIANFWYIVFKYRLYLQHLHRAIRAPWVLLLLICETTYLVSTVVVASANILPPRSRPVLRLDASKSYPTVDIFIPCYKEPLDVLQDTIAAALAVDYPEDRFRLLVLDDGADADLQAFCLALKAEKGGRVEYICRKKIPGAPKDFKGGNMNNGLRHATAEYVLFMDADMIMHPSILHRTLPFIVDSPDIGFVQVPQSFYNLPVGDPLDDSNTLFYFVILSQRDQLGCCSFIGTGAVFRRQYLLEIAGFQPGSVTEDTLTAYVLFNHGYRSVYVNDKLQAGLAPWTFTAYVEQRQRWTIGAMQQLGVSWRDMLGSKSKLSMVEKVWYVWHTTNTFLCLNNMLLMFILFGALAFRLTLVVTDDEKANRQLMVYLALHLILWRVAWFFLWCTLPQSLLSRNRSESHFWWMSPFYIRISLQALFHGTRSFSSKFLPTNSSELQASSSNTPMKLVRFHIAFTVVSVVVTSYRFYGILANGLRDCKEDFHTLGLSIFLLATSAHLMTPVVYVMRARMDSEQRRSLLRYSDSGVPHFPVTEDLLPKWDGSVLLNEFFGVVQFTFWSSVFIAYTTSLYPSLHQWCSSPPSSQPSSYNSY